MKKLRVENSHYFCPSCGSNDTWESNRYDATLPEQNVCSNCETIFYICENRYADNKILEVIRKIKKEVTKNE